MKKILKFFLSLFYFIVFCILGLIVGIGIGFGFLFLKANGSFSFWNPLNSEYEFNKIVTADAQTVWARASNGKVYSWNTNCYHENCNQWIEAKEIPENDFESDTGEKIEINNSCNGVRKTPRRVIECAHVLSIGADYMVNVYYALIADGTIWMWENSGNSIEIQIMPLCGGGFGIIAGIMGYLIFMTRNITKSEQFSASTV